MMRVITTGERWGRDDLGFATAGRNRDYYDSGVGSILVGAFGSTTGLVIGSSEAATRFEGPPLRGRKQHPTTLMKDPASTTEYEVVVRFPLIVQPAACNVSRMSAELFEYAAKLAAEHLAGVHSLPVSHPCSPSELRIELEGFDFAGPRNAFEVLDASAELLRSGITHTTHPRYFGLFNTPPLAPGVAAELIAAAFNPQLAVWSHAPAAVEIEQHTLRFVGARLGFDETQVAGSFTSGGAEANHTAVLVALTRTFADFGAVGVRGLRGQPRIYASHEAHGALAKIAHACGIGRDAIRLIATTSDFAMDPKLLDHAITRDRAAGERPFLVVATAGTTSGGAIDPLPAIADVCAAHRVRLHVDAAWGRGSLPE